MCWNWPIEFHGPNLADFLIQSLLNSCEKCHWGPWPGCCQGAWLIILHKINLSPNCFIKKIFVPTFIKITSWVAKNIWRNQVQIWNKIPLIWFNFFGFHYSMLRPRARWTWLLTISPDVDSQVNFTLGVWCSMFRKRPRIVAVKCIRCHCDCNC